ncbi:hypothetical protein COY93_00405 [Candidatus Uhrbacteria bacterium CG_4_10_14_0_8_um_filter_58_22]|uniref:Uncharacterized protein n=1 Tax=Candidatus Uhrbacteria bacterium CG_4_10_14_0_8_um_filter_58_22 TaxID=1975029 RepID=A0A2M7QBU3_9BACT|nr:MAG: hypothetical protein AUJ19_04920 [Parcubacteria group bacterium CG1_02_58_44]PIY63340.1 MAG: hypothetical protein COY93_00405 [Candidatus Uhrbacteria bacterium CG_4_10_14_0_8_um_filter_58_22]
MPHGTVPKGVRGASPVPPRSGAGGSGGPEVPRVEEERPGFPPPLKLSPFTKASGDGDGGQAGSEAGTTKVFKDTAFLKILSFRNCIPSLFVIPEGRAERGLSGIQKMNVIPHSKLVIPALSRDPGQRKEKDPLSRS